MNNDQNREWEDRKEAERVFTKNPKRIMVITRLNLSQREALEELIALGPCRPTGYEWCGKLEYTAIAPRDQLIAWADRWTPFRAISGVYPDCIRQPDLELVTRNWPAPLSHELYYSWANRELILYTPLGAILRRESVNSRDDFQKKIATICLVEDGEDLSEWYYNLKDDSLYKEWAWVDEEVA